MDKLNCTKSILQALPIGRILRGVRKTACVSSRVGPWSAGHRLLFVVHVDRIHPLVEKAKQAADRRTGGQRIAVAPHDVLENPIADRRGPIRRLALIWTPVARPGWPSYGPAVVPFPRATRLPSSRA